MHPKYETKYRVPNWSEYDRVFSFSPKAFRHGVQVHRIARVGVRITSPAKTVADCFKFRSTVGTDVAVEVLRSYRQSDAGTMDELWAGAEVCRMTNVMRRYLEGLL